MNIEFYHKMAENKQDLHDYPFVSRRYWSFTTNGFYFWTIIASVFSNISSKSSKIKQLLRSRDNTHTDTQTEYYNPLGLIIMNHNNYTMILLSEDTLSVREQSNDMVLT